MRLIVSALSLVVLAGLALAGDDKKPEKLLVYIGTYTNPKGSQGIYRLELDLQSGRLTAPTLAGRVANPSFLALHPSGKYLYAVGEISNFLKKPTGVVSAFSIDDKGDLFLLNQKSSQGAGPCHIVLDRAGKFAFCANYGGGSCAVLPIDQEGKLLDASSAIQHKGKSVNPARQQQPHAHSINLDPANRFAFVADLGLDQVLVYRFDPESGKLTPNDPAFAPVKPGAGPRHFAFHPSGKFAYVINELANTITGFRYDAEKGSLEEIESVTTLPPDFKDVSHTAEVVVHPTGKFLYGSNRGHDSIAIFRVDQETGKLQAAGHQGKGIRTPRNFAIDPTGKFCLVASQAGDKLHVFRIDASTGALEPTDHEAAIPSPVCIRFRAR